MPTPRSSLRSRAYVLEMGRIVLEGPDLLGDPRVRSAYLGEIEGALILPPFCDRASGGDPDIFAPGYVPQQLLEIADAKRVPHEPRMNIEHKQASCAASIGGKPVQRLCDTRHPAAHGDTTVKMAEDVVAIHSDRN